MAELTYNPIENAVDSVEAFNGLTMDQSKDMFRGCLGTEFPFDVLEAVDNYANKLKDILNGNLDSLICGNAGAKIADASKTVFVDSFNSTVDAYNTFSDDKSNLKAELTPVETVTQNPDGSITTTINTVATIKRTEEIEEATRMDNIIPTYKWQDMCPYFSDSENTQWSEIIDGAYKVEYELTNKSSTNCKFTHKYHALNEFGIHALGAESITINLTATSKNGEIITIKKIEDDSGYDSRKYLYTIDFDYKINVYVKDLRRGPEGSATALPPASGAFETSGTFSQTYVQDNIYSLKDFNPQTINLPAKEVTMEGLPGISLKISPIAINITDNLEYVPNNVAQILPKKNQLPPSFIIGLSNLRFENEWSDYSSNLTPEQQAQAKAAKEESDKLKNMAMNSLRSQFMSSSVVNSAMYEEIEKMTAGCPALAGINVQNINDAVKGSIADNAIALANGDPLSIDKNVISTIASEVSASSINKGLESLGIDNSISSDCTKELLDGLIKLLPDATLDNPFGGMGDFIGFGDALALAKGVLSKLVSMFESLMNAECMVAINNAFDVCSHDLAVAAGNSLTVVNESLKDPTSSIDSTKEFI